MSEKPSWVSILDEQITELNRNIKEIKDCLNFYVKILFYEIRIHTILSYMRSLTSTYKLVVAPPPKPEFFDSLIELMKERNALIKESLNICKDIINISEIIIPSPEILEIIIKRAKTYKIEFKDIASYIIDKFGKQEARELVLKHVILENYGEEAYKIWQDLIQ